MIFVACSSCQRLMLIAPEAYVNAPDTRKCTNASVALQKIENISHNLDPPLIVRKNVHGWDSNPSSLHT